MIKNFRGVVKVEDVQAAFDELITRINRAVDSYNAALDLYEVDFNISSSKIGTKNQTLSIGGLKKILDAYNNSVHNCRVYKISDTKAMVAGGFVIKNRTVYKLPTKTVAINESSTAIYFNTANNTYSTTSGTNKIEIARINTLSSSISLNRAKALAEKFPQWSMKIKDSLKGYYDNESFTTSSGKFIGGVAGRNNSTYLLGDQDSSGRGTSDHRETGGIKDSFWEPFNYLWVPKGLSNPYSYVYRWADRKAEKVWQKEIVYNND